MIHTFVSFIQVQRHDDGLHGVDFARVRLASFHGSLVVAPVNLQHGIAEAEGPHGTRAERDERLLGEHRGIEVVGRGVELAVELRHHLHVWLWVRYAHVRLKECLQRIDWVFRLVFVIAEVHKLTAACQQVAKTGDKQRGLEYLPL